MTRPPVELKRLWGIHLEAARLAAGGHSWAEIGQKLNVKGLALARWRKSKLFLDKVAEYKLTTLHEDLAVVDKKSPRAIARMLFEDAIVDAARKIIAGLKEGTYSQQAEIAKEILKLTGHYVGEKSGQIVININADDVAKLHQGAVDMGFIEASDLTRKALPQSFMPLEAPA